jgi:hypothetical protein
LSDPHPCSTGINQGVHDTLVTLDVMQVCTFRDMEKHAVITIVSEEFPDTIATRV